MNFVAEFDTAKIIDWQCSNLIIPPQAPVVLNSNWNNLFGLVNIYPDFNGKLFILHFSLYNNKLVKSVNYYTYKPMLKTSYHSLKIIQLTAFSFTLKK